MNGKNTFTLKEANEIKELINKIRLAPREEQIILRACLRKEKHFWITRFTQKKSFTVEDFNLLVEDGSVKIVGI